MRWIYRLLHILYLGRAVRRGPQYFVGYELRRQTRKAVYRITRPARRRH